MVTLGCFSPRPNVPLDTITLLIESQSRGVTSSHKRELALAGLLQQGIALLFPRDHPALQIQDIGISQLD